MKWGKKKNKKREEASLPLYLQIGEGCLFWRRKEREAPGGARFHLSRVSWSFEFLSDEGKDSARFGCAED